MHHILILSLWLHFNKKCIHLGIFLILLYCMEIKKRIKKSVLNIIKNIVAGLHDDLKNCQ